MTSDVVRGDYRGISYAHRYNVGNDDRVGEIFFPDRPEIVHTNGGGAPTWEARVRDLIDAYYRELDMEPDDDSEA